MVYIVTNANREVCGVYNSASEANDRATGLATMPGNLTAKYTPYGDGAWSHYTPANGEYFVAVHQYGDCTPA